MEADYDYENLGDEGLNKAKEEAKKRQLEALKPYQYKKGQSGNPSGRPAGISLKEYVKMKFNTMNDEEREEFLNGLSKDTIWEMGEGKAEAKTDTTIKGELTITIPPEREEEIKKAITNL